LLVLGLLWPMAAMGETAVPGFRDLVVAGDIAQVEAALKSAVAADQAPEAEPDAERDLFSLFTDSHPAIAALTERWLAEQPDDALAMTARGWHLYALGWNARGTGNGRDAPLPRCGL
jgi:hypothetical protein